MSEREGLGSEGDCLGQQLHLSSCSTEPLGTPDLPELCWWRLRQLAEVVTLSAVGPSWGYSDGAAPLPITALSVKLTLMTAVFLQMLPGCPFPASPPSGRLALWLLQHLCLPLPPWPLSPLHLL